MKWLYLCCTLLTFSACGVEWFPEDTKGGSGSTGNAAAPAFFNFSTQTVSIRTLANQTNPSAPIASNVVTLKGTNTSGWPITFHNYTGTTGQLTVGDNAGGITLSYNSDTAIPNVLPEQTLQVDQTPTLTVGKSAISRITVGTFTTNFIISTIQ